MGRHELAMLSHRNVVIATVSKSTYSHVNFISTFDFVWGGGGSQGIHFEVVSYSSFSFMLQGALLEP